MGDGDDDDIAYSSDTVVPSPVSSKGFEKAGSVTPDPVRRIRVPKKRFQKERSYSGGPWGPEF